MTLYRVDHVTTYEYSEPVLTSHNEARVLPRRLDRQDLRNLELRIDPTPACVVWRQDYFENDLVFFNLDQPHERLVIRSTSSVDVRPAPSLTPERSPRWEEVAQDVRRDKSEAFLGAFECVFDSPFVRCSLELAAYARTSFPRGRPLLEGLLDLNRRIHAEFRYDQEATDVATPVEEILAERHGVCQDFAHLMIGCLRSLGLPARYVSGYLRSSGPAATRALSSAEEAALVGAEASHAWVSTFCPGQGWVDVDPTNDLVVSDRHVTLAWGRDYDDVSPVKGVTLGGGEHTVSVVVEMQPADA